MHLFIVETLIVGFCFRNSGSVGMHGSPAPAVTASESLISIQFYKSFSARESDGPGAGSVNLAEERVSGLDFEGRPNKVAR